MKTIGALLAVLLLCTLGWLILVTVAILLFSSAAYVLAHAFAFV